MPKVMPPKAFNAGPFHGRTPSLVIEINHRLTGYSCNRVPLAVAAKPDEPPAKEGGAMATKNNYWIRWKNYRVFTDTGWVELRPLTVVIGTNSSGKTSLLSPLVLLSQTMLSAEDVGSPIIPHGKLIDVGSYKNYVNEHSVKKNVSLAFRFESNPTPSKPQLKSVGTYPPGAIEVKLKSGTTHQGARLWSYEIFDVYCRSYLKHNRGARGYKLSGVIPANTLTSDERAAIAASSPMNFVFTPTVTISALNQVSAKRGGEGQQPKKKQFSKGFTHYLMAIGRARDRLTDIFYQLSYIGPIRNAANRFYRIRGEAPPTVGAHGEDAPQIFFHASANLKHRINKWIKKFEFGDKLTCPKVGDDLFELNLTRQSLTQNIADAGFGVSQVIPLIVQACAARKDTLTIAEQPEIHLNPRLQGMLAELFVEMATTRHRIVVETHSEHLLIRLRTLVASGKISPDDVAVYFVERGATGSRVREVPIDETGSIADGRWPEGFFDDSLRESLALAAAQHEARKRVVKK